MATTKNPVLVLANIGIIALWVLPQIIEIPFTVQILTMVTCILYVACHKSLTLREEQALATSGSGTVETMRKEDAMQFPLVGSVALFSLYLSFKYLDKDWVNFIIGIYFSAVGSLAVTASLAPVLSTIVPREIDEKLRVEKNYSYPHKLPEFLVDPSPFKLEIDICLSSVVAFGMSVIFGVYYFQTRYWAANNILGIAFCLQGIERFSLGSYKIGAILLVGLFFYDIFWVFGTDVMVRNSWLFD